MGISWDEMGQAYLPWDGMGWNRKICSMDKPANCMISLRDHLTLLMKI